MQLIGERGEQRKRTCRDHGACSVSCRWSHGGSDDIVCSSEARLLIKKFSSSLERGCICGEVRGAYYYS
ncbi:hypothetical protein EUGRSUZ_H03844 [Eucalyptus grandis]|uniref:Uncharacterized protein n=2 Tax=Eucalyptus grandis TaxID=71139 RepID=A0ACC3JVU8_EUCGR|nr:hypothetical protein EUGRSUZ_H03844 [Eucalyptus grandis]